MELITDSSQSISILCVDDDGHILEILSSVLSVNFPDVIFYTAINGRLGLELFKEHTPDIVLTDIIMPEMSGVQMSENIRALSTNTKIIAITGRIGDSGVNGDLVMRNSDGNKVEFDHIIGKPVDISELSGVIEHFIGQI
jgi:CheY-like chemotaxis protein